MMFPKYNSWEDLKETFEHEMIFECEGEIFLLTDTHVFHVNDNDAFVLINKDTICPKGVVITVVQKRACAQYCYRKVDFV